MKNKSSGCFWQCMYGALYFPYSNCQWCGALGFVMCIPVYLNDWFSMRICNGRLSRHLYIGYYLFAVLSHKSFMCEMRCNGSFCTMVVKPSGSSVETLPLSITANVKVIWHKSTVIIIYWVSVGRSWIYDFFLNFLMFESFSIMCTSIATIWKVFVVFFFNKGRSRNKGEAFLTRM